MSLMDHTMPQQAFSLPARLIEAVAFAADKHRNQRRKDLDASPYVNHPIALARVLACEAGIDEIDVLCGAILHDTVEDTDTTIEELNTRFGDNVAALVGEVTDDKSLPKAERKARQVADAPKKSRGAALIKLADKICNLRDIVASPPHDWSEERKAEYFNWARQVVDRLPAVSQKLRQLFDDAWSAGAPQKRVVRGKSFSGLPPRAGTLCCRGCEWGRDGFIGCA